MAKHTEGASQATNGSTTEQGRSDVQRWRTTGPDYPEMLGINPNIGPLTALGGKLRGGYKTYRKTGDRHQFGPYS